MLRCGEEIAGFLYGVAALGGRRNFTTANVEEFSVFRRPGSDLLFHALGRSTIGAGAIYGRVRDGIGYGHPAKATRPAKNRGNEAH